MDSENAVSVFPNPASEKIIVILPQKSNIEILNIEGQVILTIKSDFEETTVNLANLSNGVYILKAKTSKGIIVKKFIKQ